MKDFIQQLSDCQVMAKTFSGFSFSVSSPINGVLLMDVILLKLLLLCMTSIAVKHIA